MIGNYCLTRGEKPSPSGEDFSMHTVCRFFRFPLVRISVLFVLSFPPEADPLLAEADFSQ